MTAHRWGWTPTRVCTVTAPIHSLYQWFSTFSLKGATSRPTILLESLNQKFLTHFNLHVFFSRTKSVTQNIRRFIKKDCWGPHKGCLGAECGPQNRGWEPLVYISWIDSHRRVDEGLTVGSCRIKSLLFADDSALLASSQQSLACTLSVFCYVRPSRNEYQH